ncbi:MAG TPA: DUF6491 family protein [Steroidobacteraceae bacterium]|jgi:hypothetical protein
MVLESSKLRLVLTTSVLTFLALLSACADIPLSHREEAERARYLQYAGAPIDEFTYLGRYDSWTALSKDEVVVWTTINNAYLITVAQPCTDIMFVQRIGLTSTLHTVSKRFDFVKVHGQNCFIKEIRPVDYLKMKQDARKAREEAAAQKKG